MGKSVRRTIGDDQLEEVEAFYDEKRQEEETERASDSFYNYRCFQNWVKSVLIREGARLARQGTSDRGVGELVVLDIGCGKGGDLRKFSYERISAYVGVDVALGQLRDALRRKTRARLEYPTVFVRANAFATPETLYGKLPRPFQFNLVSAQFCLHYFFSSEDCVRAFLANVTQKLARGGVFIATFPDAEVIAKNTQEGYLRGEDPLIHENSAFSLMLPLEEARKGKLGPRYGFFLDNGLIGSQSESTDEVTIKYVPEFLVTMSVFEKLANEAGLELVESQNFHAFYATHIANPLYFELFRNIRFGATEDSSIMPDDHWQTAYLYRTAIFRRTDGDPFDRQQSLPPKHYFKLIP